MRKEKIKTWAVISNYNDAIYDFDGDLASRVMSNKTAKKRFTDQLITLVKSTHITESISILKQ